MVNWGIIGCGDVTEVKSGPGFQKATGSRLVAVMRRDGEKVADYARRHGVPKFYTKAEELIEDPDVSAVYIATPPSSHLELALRVARAGKPCLVEKPMAMNHQECLTMSRAFRERGCGLFVAYYRRALPRFTKVRELLQSGSIGQITSVRIAFFEALSEGPAVSNWRFDPAVAGAGLFYDLASHGLDLLDFFFGPISKSAGFAVNTGRAYAAEDVTSGVFEFQSGILGTGTWNFNSFHVEDSISVFGTDGWLQVPVFFDGDIHLTRGSEETVLPYRNPPHVHQPLIQTIIDELNDEGFCESTGESGARTSWVLDECVREYYRNST